MLTCKSLSSERLGGMVPSNWLCCNHSPRKVSGKREGIFPCSAFLLRLR